MKQIRCSKNCQDQKRKALENDWTIWIIKHKYIRIHVAEFDATYHQSDSLVTPMPMDKQEFLQKPKLCNCKITSHHSLHRVESLDGSINA